MVHTNLESYIKELVENNVDSREIACWVWKLFSGKFQSKNYANRGGANLIGYSQETCGWCGETYNFYGGHECNIPIHDVVVASLKIKEVYPDVAKIIEIAKELVKC